MEMQKFALFALLLLLVITPCAAVAGGIEAPSLFLPVSGAHLRDTTPRFDWSLVGGAENYEIQYSTDNAFSSGYVGVRSNITGVSLELENALPDNVYYWRVRAGRTSGEVGPWSQTRSFTIDTTPTLPPTLTSPGNGAYLQLLSVDLSWSAASGASSYRVMIDNVAEFSSPLENAITTGISYNKSGLSNGKYYWKVASRDLVGNENYSGVWEFVVDSVPPTVTLQTPADGENENSAAPLLTWSATDSRGLKSYEVWVDSVLVGVENDATRMTENAPSLLDGTHKWRVRAFDLAGNWSFSPEFSFYVDTVPPPTPGKSSPANGARFSSKVVDFQWSTVTDRGYPVSSYELWVDNDPNFGSPVRLESVTGSSRSATLSDGFYYWRVRACDSAGNMGSFENAWSFMVDNTLPPTPSMISPAAGSLIETDQRPTFSWGEVSDVSVVKYELQVDDDNTFSSALFSAVLDDTTFTPTYDMFDDEYWWRVRTIDNFSRAGSWPDNIKFEILYRDFTVTAGYEVQVEQGGLESRLVAVTALGRYRRNVELYATGQPVDVSVRLDGGGYPHFSAILYVAPKENAKPGDYTVTIVGYDSIGWERTTSFELEVLRRPLVEIAHMSAGEVTTVTAGVDKVSELEVGAGQGVENAALYMWSEEAPEAPVTATLKYSYFTIESENLEGGLSSVNIKFWVDRAWIEQNNADLQTVKLMRYQDGAWQELPTQQSGADANAVYFSATSSGLSTFAIVAEQSPGPPGVASCVYLVPVLAVVAGVASWFLRGRQASSVPEIPRDSKEKRAPRKTKGDKW